MQDLDVLRYPIGRFDYGTPIPLGETRAHIAEIDKLPIKLTELVGKWGDERLDTPYRPEGWTVRQLVHHIADSHINAYVRTKLALTEDNPTIKPYEEGEWAKLPDSQLDVALSLVILRNLHQRWVTLLDSLTETQLLRTYFHPATQRMVPLSEVIGMYAWHGEHHYQHIYRLAAREGWLEHTT
ncbi:putative metal-dependent hydrolase [Spirosoma taeanense]|uniref:Putative metal-dependent hydrolase n=1 Tax=Spirosoma taeanense TaxID=2735870 RepID=A0A6M5YA85_9BACT|nr:putative metal-dependent hydrolase [Spirosoma taeanense]QJW90210.1 putative metal-dependent hydrolase [Spirosoma taeanense]